MPEPRSAFTAGADHGGIDADGADLGRRVGEAERLDEVVAQRPAGLGAEAVHAARRVVAGQRGEVDAGERLDEPGGLELLLHGAARCRWSRRGARRR